MTNLAPQPVDVLDYQFKLHCRLKVFENDSYDEFNSVCSLVAAASRYGMVFVGTTAKNFHVIPLYEIEQLSAKDGEVSAYIRRVVELPSKPQHISVNCDSTKLSVVVVQNGCATAIIYDVLSFLKQQIVVTNEIRLSATPGVSITDTNWNPSLPEIYTACKDDGSLGVYEVKDGSFQIYELPVSAGATCFCWSPKGKQIAIGSRDGKITQYKPDLKAVKLVNAPPLNGPPQPIIALQWVSNYQFIGVFRTNNPDAPQALIVIDSPKAGNPVYTNYDDVCYSYGTNRPSQFNMILQQHWNILMVTSSNSMEVGVMSLNKDIWTQWMLGDSSRAEFPLSASKQDTLPVGVAFDTGSTQNIQCGEATIPPAPRLLILLHHGVLCCFNAINLRQGAPSICSPPERLADTSGINQFAKNYIEKKIEPIQQVQPVSQPNQPAAFQVQPATTQPALTTPLPSQAPSFGPVSGSLFGNKPFAPLPKSDPPSYSTKPTALPLGINLSQPPPNIQPILTVPQSTGFSQIVIPQQSVQPTTQQAPVQQSILQQPPIQQPITQPPPMQQPNKPLQSFTIKPNSVPNLPQTTATSNVEIPKPLTNLVPTSEAVEVLKTDERIPINEETEAMIAQLVREECVTLETELKALLHRGRAMKIDVGNDGEATQMVRNTNALSEFVSEITETSNFQAAEVHMLKQNLVQTWAWYEEARSRFMTSKDDTLLKILQAQPLDPSSQRQLTDIRHMIYYLDSQLRQANNSLDEQWDYFQDACKNNISIRVPTMEAIYQSMVKQSATLQKQAYILKDISSRIKSVKRNQGDAGRVLISLDKTQNLEEELQKLHLYPENIRAYEYTNVLGRQKAFTKTKSDKLYKILSNRSITHIAILKPNLNESTTQLTSLLHFPLSPIPGPAPTNKPLKQIQPQKLDFLMSTPKPLLPPHSKPSSAFAPTSATSTMPVIFKSATAPKEKLDTITSTAQKHTLFGIAIPKTTYTASVASTNVSNKNTGFVAVPGSPGFSFVPGSTKSSFTFDSQTPATGNVVQFPIRTDDFTITPIKVPTTPSALPASTTTSFFAINTPASVATTQSSAFGMHFSPPPPVAPNKISEFTFTVKPTSQESVKVVSQESIIKPISQESAKPTNEESVKSTLQESIKPIGILFGSGTDSVTTMQSTEPNITGATTSILSQKIQPTNILGTSVTTTDPFTSTVPTTTTTKLSSFTFGSKFTTPPPSSTLPGQTPIIGAASKPITATTASSTILNIPTIYAPTSIFGAPPSTSSLFESPLTTTPSTSSMFGSSAGPLSSSIFGSPATPSASGASLPISSVTTSTNSIFGAPPTSTSSLFGTPPLPVSPLFGASTGTASEIPSTKSSIIATTPLFATTTTTSIYASSSDTVSSPISTTTSPLFGGPVSSTGDINKQSVIATPATPPTFGSTSTSTPFGASDTNTTSTTQTPIFGATTTTTTKSSLFGALPTASTQSSIFGDPNMGTPASSANTAFPPPSSPFSSAPPSFGTQSAFGSATSQQSSAFSSATSPATTMTSTSSGFASSGAFGGTAAFGQSATSTFNPSPFGNATTPTDKVSPFGGSGTFGAVSSSTPSGSLFGQPSSFGQGSIFGGNQPTNSASTNVFGGGAVTSSAPPAFGAASNSVFGSPATSTTPFGASGSVFGTPAVSSSPFGAPAISGSPFGAPANASPFGATTQANSFNFANAAGSNVPANTFGGTGGFGSKPTSFGSGFGSPTAESGSFSFGGLNVASPTTTASSVFGSSTFGQTAQNPFGRSSGQEQPKSPFAGGSLFGSPAATTSSSIFGTPSPFGKPAAPAFGSPSTFGSPSAFGGQAAFGQQSSFGGGTAFGNSPQQGGGPFSAQTQSVQQTGFGSPAYQKPATGFGAAPVFGGNTAGFGAAPSFGAQGGFGSPPAFGSPTKVFGGPADTTTAFGGMTQQNSNFGNIANQNTLGFGNLAQQAPSTQSSFSGGSSFSSWR